MAVEFESALITYLETAFSETIIPIFFLEAAYPLLRKVLYIDFVGVAWDPPFEASLPESLAKFNDL